MNSYERIQKSIDYIEDHLTDTVSPGRAAREACFSLSHFYRIFHALAGQPVKEYIRRRRLHEAAVRLIESDDRLIDICFDYQFAYQESFTRAFKAVYGMTPGKFRKRPFAVPSFQRIDLIDRYFVPGEINLLDPRIKVLKRLPPMTVATYRAVGPSPEHRAMNTLMAWADKKGLLKKEPQYRLFGFDNPGPVPGKTEYGYEFWMTVADDIEGGGSVRIRTFPGGEYAVTGTTIPDIKKSWAHFVSWLKISRYRPGSHRCLEEHLSPAGTSEEKMQIDLYLPIEIPLSRKGGNHDR